MSIMLDVCCVHEVNWFDVRVKCIWLAAGLV